MKLTDTRALKRIVPGAMVAFSPVEKLPPAVVEQFAEALRPLRRASAPRRRVISPGIRS
jgi:hypothetical protein